MIKLKKVVLNILIIFFILGQVVMPVYPEVKKEDGNIVNQEKNSISDLESNNINNYLNGDKGTSLNNCLYAITSVGIEKFNKELNKREVIPNTSEATRIYKSDNKIYFIVRDGIKLMDEQGSHEYVYQNEGFKSNYCQLSNGKIYFLEYGTYDEWSIDTTGKIDVSNNETEALASIDLETKKKKIYYYVTIYPTKDDDSTIQLKATRKVVALKSDEQFIVVGNEVFHKKSTYNLAIEDKDIIIGTTNYSDVIGYNNGAFYSRNSNGFYRVPLKGISKQIDKNTSIRGVFSYNNKLYAIDYEEKVYLILDNKLEEIGYITGTSNLFNIDDRVYSIQKDFGVMLLNIEGNDIVEEATNYDRNNSLNQFKYGNFAYDNNKFYIAKNSVIEIWNKELDIRESFDLSDDTKNNIQKYNNSIVYHNGKSIKMINFLGNATSLYETNLENSQYKISKIQVVDKYVYFLETIDKNGNYNNSRIGRIDIENKKIEYIVYGDTTHSSDNINFLVYDNKIYYDTKDWAGYNCVFVYDIKNGVAKRLDGIEKLRGSETIVNNTLYYLSNNLVSRININNFEKVEMYNVLDEGIYDLFAFQGRVYAKGSEDRIYILGNESLELLGYNTGVGNTYTTEDKVLSLGENFGLMPLNIGGNEIIKNTSSYDKINSQNQFGYGNFIYDDKNIYFSNNHIIEKWNRDLSIKEELVLNEDVKNNIQRYGNKFIYHNGKGIKTVDLYGNETILYETNLSDSWYKISKIQAVGNYVFFAETIDKGNLDNYTKSRIGRVNIETKKVEYLIDNDVTHKYDDVNFLVYDNKIYYDSRNGLAVNNIFVYDIETGFARKVEYLNQNLGFTGREVILNDSLYYLTDHVLYKMDINNLKFERMYDVESEGINDLFNFNNEIYAVSDEKCIYKVNDTNIEKLGYINSGLNILVTDNRLYTINKNKITKINTIINTLNTSWIGGKSEEGSTVIAKLNKNEVGRAVASSNGVFNMKINDVKKDDKIMIYTIDRYGNESPEITIRVENYSGDFDANGEINIIDLAFLARNYGLTLEDKEYSKDYDLNNDGIIDIFDLVLLSKQIS